MSRCAGTNPMLRPKLTRPHNSTAVPRIAIVFAKKAGANALPSFCIPQVRKPQ